MHKVGTALALCGALALPGCAALIPAGAAIGTIGGSLAIANEAVQLAGNVLTTSAKLACAVQAYANLKGDSELSKTAGAFCVW